MDIRNNGRLYRTGKIVAEAANYRLYLCIQDETGRQCLLQIAAAKEHNGKLQRAAYVLGDLESRSQEIEAEYAKVKTDPKMLLNYQLGFPELVDSFICEEQGGRQINILAFRSVDEVSSMVPIANITEKDRRRIDLRTSAWIMGKLLKTLAFVHGEGYSVGLMSGYNIVIEPGEHYSVIFDWSEALTHPDLVPEELRRQDIAQAAKSVIAVLGGDPETGFFPDVDDNSNQYANYLLRLARGKSSDAQRAHGDFYRIVDALWERKFYPFVSKPLA